MLRVDKEFGIILQRTISPPAQWLYIGMKVPFIELPLIRNFPKNLQFAQVGTIKFGHGMYFDIVQ